MRGELAVLSCVNCGHGWLSETQFENAHYESEGYSQWRQASEASSVTRARRYVDDFLAHAPMPRTVVEVGCSTGETASRFAELGARVWAADMSQAAIAQAGASHPDVHFVVGELPQPDEPVDVVVMTHLIEHVPDPVALLTRCRALAQPNGLLYLRTPNYRSLAARTLGWAWPDYIPEHLHYFTPASIKLACATAGWKASRLLTVGGSWAWLGGARRIVSRRRPQLRTNARARAAPTVSTRQLKVLAAADRVMRFALALEERQGWGNEIVLTASSRDASRP